MESEARVNIPSSIEDKFYRYWMPKMVLKYVGKNTGIKTSIENLEKLAAKLRVQPQLILKFISYELGTRSSKDRSKSKFSLLLIKSNLI